MRIVDYANRTLFFGGLLMVTLSFMLDSFFATDATPLPEPHAWSLLAIGGVAAIAVSLIRRRKK